MKYSELANLYESLESTTKNLEKTEILAKFIKAVPAEALEDLCLLVQGRVFPEWSSQEIGLGAKLALRAISSASGINSKDVEKLWKKIGDLGEVAEQVLSKKKQATLFQQTLSVKKVVENLRKLPELQGAGTVDKKISLLKELLVSAEPKSAKYIIRTCLEELRVGVAAGILRDAIAKAFDIEKELVGAAYELSTNFGSVARIAKEQGASGLKKVKVSLQKPMKSMLYQKVNDLEEAFEVCGKPAAIEYKYDGFRLQIHRSGDKILLYTRRLEDVTKQFPDVVEHIKKAVKAKDYILDSETIGLDKKTGKWLPFQNISQRIKRKYDIEKLVQEIPVMVNVFDIMFYDGKSMIGEPFEKRRELIEKIVEPIKDKIQLAKQLVTDDVKKAEEFYKESLAKGNEGVMVKNLKAVYKPGSRVGYGVKVKPVMETLDLVIVGAEWGTGKRGGWLSSFVLACRDRGKFVEIGKMGTGVKEKKEMGMSFAELTKMLKPLVTEEKGKEVKVKPKLVVEIAYEEIQKSPSYSSGYALRFPRLVKLRDDKGPDEADSLKQIEKLYNAQRGRK